MSMDSAHRKPALAPSMSMFANSADCATYWRARCEATDLIADGLDAQAAALLAALEQIDREDPGGYYGGIARAAIEKASA